MIALLAFWAAGVSTSVAIRSLTTFFDDVVSASQDASELEQLRLPSRSSETAQENGIVPVSMRWENEGDIVNRFALKISQAAWKSLVSIFQLTMGPRYGRL